MELIIDSHLKLESTHHKHAEDLFLAIDANREHLKKFLPWVDAMATLQNAKDYIASSYSYFQKKEEISFMIINDGKLVGRIGLHHVNMQHKCSSIGYWLTKEAEGKGIMTRSCQTLINYGFETLNLNRIEIKAATRNFKSQAIPERLGFQKEGVLRKAEIVNSQPLDLILYSLLGEEWNS